MALRSCRECNAQVSTEAEVCPQCGVRNPTEDVATILARRGIPPPRQSQSGLVTFLAIVGVSLVVSWVIWATKKTPEELAQEQAQAQAQAQAQEQAQQKAPSLSPSRSETRIGDTALLRAKQGMERVFIFKSQDDISTALDLYKAGADQSLIMEHVACVVPSGTKVLITTSGITGAFMSGLGGTSDVMVVTGPDAGCKGTVSKDNLP
jgi:hypothetical protein